ncbi:MAG: hypothetical protein G01um101430_457 [Parcubacteria group bacterium Gr01-1014_30]|nr:MAG: hypothetical protein G01um101430_457 [Parcubacteria group bacterium Gr01-1014_30]
MDFLKRVQNLPLSKRKIILWSATLILAATLFIWWVRQVREQLESFPRQEFKERLQIPELPQMEQPSFDLPEISEEELRQLEEMIEESNQ